MADIRCTEAWHKRVSAYHDGGITIEEQSLVAAHLQSCDSCQRLLQEYEQLYRGLRATPGFEGILTLTKPGDRRGVGASMRPMHTYPNSGYMNGRRPQVPVFINRIITAGIVLAILAIIFIVHIAQTGSVSLSEQSAKVADKNATLQPTSLLGSQTPNGTACANAGSNNQQLTYLYARSGGEVMQVSGCSNPVSMGTILPSNFHLGSWSPNGQQLTVFTPDTLTATTIVQLAIWDKTTRQIQQVPIYVSADDAVWASNSILIVQAHHMLEAFDINTHNIVYISSSSVQQMVWRAGHLFYSTNDNGVTTLHSYDIATNNDTQLLQLPISRPTCSDLVFNCLDGAIWDITADGTRVVFTQPHQLTSTQLDVSVVRLADKTTLTTVGLPYDTVPRRLWVSPDSQYVAIATESTSSRPVTVEVMALSDITTLEPIRVTALDSLVWRPDSQALVIEPLHQSPTVVPQLLRLATGKTTPLQLITSDYVWEP